MDQPVIMGILNVTPDSFSDGGRYFHLEEAIRHAEKLAAEGADIIDVGGESTRPGSLPVDPKEELNRVIPVIRALVQRGYTVSVDTVKTEVAGAAMEAGAHMINDISGLRDGNEMAEIGAKYQAGYILMHMQGTPRTMQSAPVYKDVIAEVTDFLDKAAQKALLSGLEKNRIVLDPGIGFGKTLEHNLELIRHLEKLTDIGFPVLLGASRKSFIQMITGASVSDRLAGSLATALVAWKKGVSIFRVHDVAETKQALQVLTALGKEKI